MNCVFKMLVEFNIDIEALYIIDDGDEMNVTYVLLLLVLIQKSKLLENKC